MCVCLSMQVERKPKNTVCNHFNHRCSWRRLKLKIFFEGVLPLLLSWLISHLFFLNALSVGVTLSCMQEIEPPFTAKLYILTTFYTIDDSLGINDASTHKCVKFFPLLFCLSEKCSPSFPHVYTYTQIQSPVPLWGGHEIWGYHGNTHQ